RPMSGCHQLSGHRGMADHHRSVEASQRHALLRSDGAIGREQRLVAAQASDRHPGTMSDQLRDTLEAQREERIARAGRRLVDGESPRDVQSDLDEIAAYDKLLAHIEPRRERTWIVPATVAVVCVAVAGLLW